MSKYIGKAPCPQCGSKDNLAVYDDHSYCFSEDCGYYISNGKEHKVSVNLSDELPKGIFHRIKSRGLTEDTCKKYGTTVSAGEDKKIDRIYFPDINIAGEQVAVKTKTVPQDDSKASYSWLGQPSGLFFGQHLFPKGSANAITVTEGYEDAMSVYQMQGSKYPSVSITNGASGAVKDFQNNLEYLESFNEVYICFDSDIPGKKAAELCAQKLSPGKAKIVHLDAELKDANEYLKAGKQDIFISKWWKAELYTPAGIISSTALKDRIRNRKVAKSFPFPWQGLNDKIYGLRMGEVCTFWADTGVGKTQVLREIAHYILKNDPQAKIGTMFLEETPEISGLGLMSVEGNCRFHLPDAKFTEKDYDEAEKILDGDRVFFYDSFGSTQIDDIISRVRYYVKGLDCKYVILDHLSIIVSDQLQGDERKLLDSIMTRLKTLTIELDMCLICVVHQNRKGEIRGTAAIEQLSNTVIRLDRDKINPDPNIRNTTFITIYKDRNSGRSGPACALRFDENTGRLYEVDEDFSILEKFEFEE